MDECMGGSLFDICGSPQFAASMQIPVLAKNSLRVLDLFYAQDVALVNLLLRNLLKTNELKETGERLGMVYPLIRMKVFP